MEVYLLLGSSLYLASGVLEGISEVARGGTCTDVFQAMKTANHKIRCFDRKKHPNAPIQTVMEAAVDEERT